MFMDARMPVTHKEGDRYPLGPPSFTALAQLDLEHCATNAGVGSSNLSGGAIDKYLNEHFNFGRQLGC